MPIDIGQSLKNLTDYTVGSSFLNGIFSSTLIISLLISTIVILLVVLTYPAKKHVGYKHIIKLFMYVLVAVGSLQLIHSSVIKYTYKKELEDPSTEAMFDNLDTSLKSTDSFESMISGQKELYVDNTSKQNNQLSVTTNPLRPPVKSLNMPAMGQSHTSSHASAHTQNHNQMTGFANSSKATAPIYRHGTPLLP